MAREGRTRNQLRRGGAKLQKLSGDVILIVCEGAKTEPLYFEFLREEWKIRTLKVVIRGEECGADPLSVVNYAIDEKNLRKREAKRSPVLSEYNQVWCVVDRDRHQTLSAAKDKARPHGIRIALSDPSFEVWFLLHYGYTTRPFENADAVIKELEKHVSSYTKSAPPNAELLERLDQAITNAERLVQHNLDTGAQSPSTAAHLVVKALRNIRGS